jgi:L-ascorbate metabolism protein UlaG (beta-lactamase superfamily)
VQNSEGTFYYSGDTALTMDMKLIGEQFNLDIALLPLGDNFTMGIDDAVIAADFIKCNNILGVHYDTFGFIKIDHDAAKATFAKAGKKLTLLGIGEVLTV